MRNIKAMSAQKSVIVISHRLANVVPADNIYFMEEGEVKESGSHDRLWKRRVAMQSCLTRRKSWRKAIKRLLPSRR